MQLAKELEDFSLHNKNALLLHSPAKCRGDLMPQTVREDSLFLTTFTRYIYMHMCVYIYAYICMYCGSVYI